VESRVVVGMSGGVDSAVAAALLKADGHEVLGVTLMLTDDKDPQEKRWQDRSCCKVGLARYVAQKLSIPHEVINLKEAFRREVIEDFCNVYLQGGTPNPCVRCNERIKFGQLLDIARGLGAATLATGHYAQIRQDAETGRFRLFQGEDTSKDQSYFLYRLNQFQLSQISFPLGSTRKEEVYSQALKLGLPYEEVLESQEICFVNQGDYREVLTTLRPEAVCRGPMLDSKGRRVGTHEGIAFYTIGQRRGLGVSAPTRLYVTEIRPQDNVVVVGEEHDLMQCEVRIGDLNWIRWQQPPFPLKVQVKLRYRTPPASASIEPIDDHRLKVRLDVPVKRGTPGQSAVFYLGNEVIGGGLILSEGD